MCFKVEGGDSYCVLKPFEKIQIGGTYIMNDVECPLLELQSRIIVVRSESVVESVSIIHQCTPACSFVQVKRPKVVEREEIEQLTLFYKHSNKNPMYCLNVYKMP